MKQILLILLLGVVSALDSQRQFEYENTLAYLIRLSQTNSLHQFDQNQNNRCVSMECCLCKQEFKSPKASAIHFFLYHRTELKKEEEMAILFDQDIPSEQRFQFCKEYLTSEGINDTKTIEQVCTVVAWNMHRSQTWLEVVKYVLFVIVGFAALIFYSDLFKPWK